MTYLQPIRDLHAEAAAVYLQAYSQAYVAGMNQGMEDPEAASYATGAGREAEEIFWEREERDAA